MATVAELERLDALVRRLTPLTTIRRGELIRADAWNTVVGALIEVARAILAEEREGAVAPHEHPDQVSAGWLDPRLRELIQRGPLSDPAADGRLLAVERRLTDLRAALQSVEAKLQDGRDRIAEVSTRDLERAADVTAVRRTVDGLADSREDVRALRGTLKSIRSDLNVALELASKLKVDGELVDMEELSERLGDLEELKERLRLPDGALLDAAALELRLTELTNTLVTEEELDAAFEARRARLDEEQVSDLKEELASSLRTELEGTIEKLATEIRDDVSSRLAEIDVLVARAVSDALPGLEESLLSTVRPEIATAVDKGKKELRGEIDGRLDELDRALREDLGGQIEDVRRSVNEAVRTEFELQLPAHLEPLRKDVSQLKAKMETVASTLQDHERRLKKLEAEVGRVSRGVDEVPKLGSRVEKFSEELSTLKEYVAAGLERVEREIEPLVATTVDRILEKQLPTLVRKEVDRILPRRSPGVVASADFTELRGVGEVGDSRLKAAGVETFADFVEKTPEQLAEILGTSADRVRSLDLIGQARARLRGR